MHAFLEASWLLHPSKTAQVIDNMPPDDWRDVEAWSVSQEWSIRKPAMFSGNTSPRYGIQACLPLLPILRSPRYWTTAFWSANIRSGKLSLSQMYETSPPHDMNDMMWILANICDCFTRSSGRWKDKAGRSMDSIKMPWARNRTQRSDTDSLTHDLSTSGVFSIYCTVYWQFQGLMGHGVMIPKFGRLGGKNIWLCYVYDDTKRHRHANRLLYLVVAWYSAGASRILLKCCWRIDVMEEELEDIHLFRAQLSCKAE